MKSKLQQAIILIISLLSLSVFSQESCGTPTPTSYFMPNSSAAAKTNLGPFCLNVRFHIVRRDNGTGGFNSADIANVVNRINRDFLPNGISIQSAGFDFINSTALFDITSQAEINTLYATNNRVDALDFYIVESASLPIGGITRILNGAAQSLLSTNLFVIRSRVATSTSSHELGHCLNLPHTHETAFGVERVDGSNCATAGDRICDTPADRETPRLSSVVDATCTYTGGGGFNPDTRNIMSYSTDACRTRFTNEQVDRMKLSLNQSSVFSNVLGSSCQIPELTGNDPACSNADARIVFSNIPAGATTAWLSSANIARVPEGNGSVIIRGVNGTRGPGWVTATFNGITLRKDVWVGAPNPPATLSGPSVVTTGALVNYNSSDAPGATSYEWRLPYPFTTITGSWDINSPRWQMRPTTIKNLTAFTGTGKISGLVQVWGKNKCGNGGAKTMSVSHSTGGGGGGGGIPFMANISGLDEAPKENAFYPNPADMDLNIYIADRASYNEIAITLISIDGRTVFTSTNKNLASIPTSHLPNGNYILNVKTEKGNETKNVIIKH